MIDSKVVETGRYGICTMYNGGKAVACIFPHEEVLLMEVAGNTAKVVKYDDISDSFITGYIDKWSIIETKRFPIDAWEKGEKKQWK